jgi:phosphoribosyl 1,2-cyclic phosphodiesterase
VRRLERLAVDPASSRASVVTHAHGDHVQGAALFSRRHQVPVYATIATREAWGPAADEVHAWDVLTPGAVTALCGVRLLPFVVPHDAAQTLAFRIDTPEGAIGFATDIGVVTAELVARFRGCVLLVIESNHATELLRFSPYAAAVKSRIGSPRGHLSNEALASFIARDLDASVRCLVLTHLSRVNNVPEIAVMTCREALARRRRSDVRIVVTHQDRVAETVDLAALVLPSLAPGMGAPLRQEGLPFA